MRLLHEIAIFQTVKSKVIISLFETVRLSVSYSLRNLYNSLNSIKERFFSFQSNPKNLDPSYKPHLDRHCLPSSLFSLNLINSNETFLLNFADINFVVYLLALLRAKLSQYYHTHLTKSIKASW